MARILLIDDEAGVRKAVARFLRTLGHDVLEAEGGGEGLRLASRVRVDLVITDLNMPGVDGIEVIMALRESAPGIPVIAISGGGLVPKGLLLDSAGLLGAMVVLAKPFELGEVRDAVARALVGRAAQAAGGPP